VVSLHHLALGRGRAPAADAIDAAVFHDFFDNKVAAVRDSAAGAGPPTFRRAATDSKLSSFVGVSAADVVAAIHRLPDKRRASDLLPTRLFKQRADELAPFLGRIYSGYLSRLVMCCRSYKAAYITPLLKKPDLDPADVRYFQPILNLPVASSGCWSGYNHTMLRPRYVPLTAEISGAQDSAI
jgi:hypothetical protein